MKVLEERIREARRILGCSQERLGELLDVEKRQVGRWESGSSYPRIQTLEKLSELTGKPVTWFFDELSPGTGDDRSLVLDLGAPLLSIGDLLSTALRQQLDGDPTWTEEEAAAHQGELLARARKRLGISQEVMNDQVLGWANRRLAQAEKGGHFSAWELAQYMQVLGISREPLAWYGPTEIVGKSLPISEPPRFKTKVDPATWCPLCELFRLLYPDFCCSAHRDSGWEVAEAKRRLKRATTLLQRAQRALEQAYENGRAKG